MGKRCRSVSPFVAGLLMACGGSGGGSSGSGSGSEALAALAIADAKALFIAGSSGQSDSSLAAAADAGESATEPAKLYKLTDDDRVLEVTRTCVDRDGRTFPCTASLTAQAVRDAGPDYATISFAAESGAIETVLARKSDGAAFLMTAFGFPGGPERCGNTSYLLGSTPVQTDATQDIYFAQQPWQGGYPGEGVVRLDVHDPGNITGAVITPETDEVCAFLVNGEGDVWYNFNSDSSPFGERFRFEAGPYAYPPQYSPWVGADNAFYALKPAGTSAGSSYDVQVYRLVPTAPSISEEPRGVVSIGGPPWGPQAGGASDFRLLGSEMLRSGDKVVLFTGQYAFDVQDPDHPTAHDISCIAGDARGSGAAFSGLAIWYLKFHETGGTGLGQFSLATDTCVELVDPAMYDVQSFVVGSDDVARFTATRMSDGRKVLAKVDSQGMITVLDEGSLFEDVSLVRIR